MRSVTVGLALVVAVAGCNKDDRAATAGAKAVVDAKELWPDAPPVDRIKGPLALRYQPDNVSGYRYEGNAVSLPGSTVRLNVHMMMRFGFAPGPAARDREARIRDVVLEAGAGAEATSLRLVRGEIVISNRGKVVVVRRGDPDVEKLVDEAFTTLTFTADNRVATIRNPEHPLGANESVDNLLLLFPDLPIREFQPGDRWIVERMVVISSELPPIEVELELHALGDGACPSGRPVCTILEVAADGEKAAASVGVTYKLRGRVYFDNERGVVDESRMHLRVDGEGFALANTYAIKTVPP